jgi:hypothetical protein
VKIEFDGSLTSAVSAWSYSGWIVFVVASSVDWFELQFSSEDLFLVEAVKSSSVNTLAVMSSCLLI